MGTIKEDDLEGIEGEVKIGAGIQEFKVVSIQEARELVQKYTTAEHQPKKQRMILTMLDEIEAFASHVKKWESDKTLGMETAKG